MQMTPRRRSKPHPHPGISRPVLLRSSTQGPSQRCRGLLARLHLALHLLLALLNPLSQGLTICILATVTKSNDINPLPMVHNSLSAAIENSLVVVQAIDRQSLIGLLLRGGQLVIV